MISLDPFVLALAAYGLPGAPPLPRDGWSDHLDAVLRHGLAGFLARANANGVVELDARSTDLLAQQLKSEAFLAVRLEGELIRLAPVLAELPAVVLKGAVLAHGAYPDPALRPFTDLDLLVAGPSHDDAVEAFETLGYVRSRPEPAPGYDARVAKALTLSHPGGGVVIDLHRTLVAGRLGVSIDVDQLLEERGSLVLAGVPIPAPSWDAHLVEVALHAVVGDGLSRALSIRDVAQVALHPHLDGDRVAALATRWKVSSTVAVGLRAAVDGLGLEPPRSLAGLAELGAVVDGGRPRSVRSAQSRLDDLRHGNLRRRVTLMRSMVAPSPDFLRWSYGRGSLPKLYGRRWLTLYQRATGAGAESTPSEPSEVPTPTGEEAPEGTSAPRPLPAGSPMSEPAAPAVGPAVGPPVTAARRPPLTTVTRHRAEGLARTPEGSNGHARARQQRWSEHRPPRPAPVPRNGGPGGPGPDGGSPAEPPAEPTDSDGRLPPPDGARRGITTAVAASGVRLFIGGVGLLVATAIGSRFGIDYLGVAFVPIAALLFAVAASRRITRTHPDESWVGRWLIIGVLAKITASYVRYLTLVVGYEGNGDASGYDHVGRQLARAWMGNGTDPGLETLRQTNFVRWFTGVVYFLFGSNMVAGFFLFGLLALLGSYLWYRATVDAVPFIDKRLYLGLVLFAPSIMFWPSSIGKESLMQLGIGAMALGTSYLVRQNLLMGLIYGGGGGWLLWVVRPHLLALVTIAAGFAYIIGRVRPSKEGSGNVLVRSLGLVVVAVLVAFSIGQGAEFLGIEDLSLSSVETSLDDQKERSAQGGSSFDNGGNYLSPVNLPRGIVTVLLRPFPWETDTPFQLLASLESAILGCFIIVRLSSLKHALIRARSTPFLLYCWVLTILYAATFASFANFGLLVRQRSLVLPALFVLLCVRPTPYGSSPDRSAVAEPLASRPVER